MRLRQMQMQMQMQMQAAFLDLLSWLPDAHTLRRKKEVLLFISHSKIGTRLCHRNVRFPTCAEEGLFQSSSSNALRALTYGGVQLMRWQPLQTAKAKLQATSLGLSRQLSAEKATGAEKSHQFPFHFNLKRKPPWPRKGHSLLQ